MERLFALLIIATSIIALPISDLEQQQWENFKRTFNREYEDKAEEQQRLEIFLQKLRHIDEHNKKYEANLVSYKKGINQFSDRTHKELANTYFREHDLSQLPQNPQMHVLPADFVVPDSIDWRERGAVTPVKDQGRCGSCWSFSSTGALEGQFFRKTGKLVSLSEQDLVDCSKSNQGCDGGLTWRAFSDVHDKGGIDTEDSYPYIGTQQKCLYDPKNSAGTDSGFVMVNNRSEDYLKAAVAEVGPISVSINANCIFDYQGGVFDDPHCNGTRLNHDVLVVGYGTTENGKDYWIVKNCWSKYYGEGGYIRMSRNKNNQCGINSCPNYPVL